MVGPVSTFPAASFTGHGLPSVERKERCRVQRYRPAATASWPRIAARVALTLIFAAAVMAAQRLTHSRDRLHRQFARSYSSSTMTQSVSDEVASTGSRTCGLWVRTGVESGAFHGVESYDAGAGEPRESRATPGARRDARTSSHRQRCCEVQEFLNARRAKSSPRSLCFRFVDHEALASCAHLLVDHVL